MDTTTIYQVTIQPIAAGAETFSGTFLQVPTLQEVKDAVARSVPFLNDIDIHNTILGAVTGLPAVGAEAYDSVAAITVRTAGVTIGTIRVTALPAFSRPTVPSPAILDRELAELIA
jgi:hypothetical protein